MEKRLETRFRAPSKRLLLVPCCQETGDLAQNRPKFSAVEIAQQPAISLFLELLAIDQQNSEGVSRLKSPCWPEIKSVVFLPAFVPMGGE